MLRVPVTVAEEQLVSLTEGLRHPSQAFTILRVVLKVRKKSEPWPSLHGRTSLQREAGLVRSETQDIFTPEGRAGGGVASCLQPQWATQSARPSTAGGLDLNCYAIPLSAVKDGDTLAVPTAASADLDPGTQSVSVKMPLADNSPGTAHFSVACAVIVIESASELEGQFEVDANVPEESLGFSQVGQLPDIPSLTRIASRSERCSGFEGEQCALGLRFCRGRELRLEPSISYCDDSGAALGPRWDCWAKTPMPHRVPIHCSPLLRRC